MVYFSSLLEKINNVARHAVRDKCFAISSLLQFAEQKKSHIVLEGEEYIIVNVIKNLLKSPTANALLYDLADKDYNIRLSHFDHYESALDHENKVIHLNISEKYPYLKKEEMRLVIALSHQLRRAWQISENYHASNRLSLTEFTRSYRLEEADAESVMIKILWELREQDYVTPWYEILSTDNSDMMLAYSGLVETDPMAGIDGRALKIAFDLWATDMERIRICDENALNACSYETESFYQGLRVMPDRHKKAKDIMENEDIISTLLF